MKWFPTIAKIRMQFEEFLIRLEMTETAIVDCWKRLDVEKSIFGDLPELTTVKERCIHVHGILNGALDGLYGGSVTPRQLASRIPKIETEISQLEMIADGMRKPLNATKAA